MNWYWVSVYLICNTVSLSLIKTQFNNQNSGYLTDWKIIAGMLLYVVSFGVWMIILKTSTNLSIAYPIVVSLGIVTIAISGYVFMHESITFRQVIGIGLIVIAIFLVNKTP